MGTNYYYSNKGKKWIKTNKKNLKFLKFSSRRFSDFFTPYI